MCERADGERRRETCCTWPCFSSRPIVWITGILKHTSWLDDKWTQIQAVVTNIRDIFLDLCNRTFTIRHVSCNLRGWQCPLTGSWMIIHCMYPGSKLTYRRSTNSDWRSTIAQTLISSGAYSGSRAKSLWGLRAYLFNLVKQTRLFIYKYLHVLYINWRKERKKTQIRHDNNSAMNMNYKMNWKSGICTVTQENNFLPQGGLKITTTTNRIVNKLNTLSKTKYSLTHDSVRGRYRSLELQSAINVGFPEKS